MRHQGSVLFVPERAKAWYKNILVPIDFSKNPEDAMKVAIAFAQASGINEIRCVHVFSVPPGFYKTGKSYEHFGELMKGRAGKSIRNS